MSSPEDQRPVSSQQVIATGGFAYGVIGADIHVFGDGTPVYLLENWQPSPEADPRWLRQLPSRMLNARFAVVGFTGREDELGQLRQWRDGTGRLALLWLHAPGGQGKTRLAARFAEQSVSAGWKVVTATRGPGTVLPPPGSQDMSLAGAAGLLLIVDYADRWPLTHLTWLLSNALLHRPDVRTRVLMLARTPDAWPAVRAAVAQQQADTASLLLPPLPADPGKRLGAFVTARDSFARNYGLASPADIAPPGSLDHPDLGLTLAVHMAALVAVDAHVTGRRPPGTMAGLTVYLLDREHLHWAQLYGDKLAGPDAAGRAFRTSPTMMNHVVFSAALAGAHARDDGIALLRPLGLAGDIDQMLTDHAVCYPPASAAPAAVLEPLYPDRLSEDFLALTVPGHPADYPAQAWSTQAVTAVLARRGRERTPPACTPRAVTYLAAAAHRWPHLGENCLGPLLRQDPQLAIDAGSAALTALADAAGIDMPVLEAIEALLPQDRHADLDPGIAALATRLAEHRLRHVEDPAARARICARLGSRLSNAGLYERALAATEEAVRLRRELSTADPAAHEPDLAASLTDLAIRLSQLGRREDALAATEQAVAVYRRLAAADRTAFEPGLANALNNLGVDLQALGRRTAALTATEQAADMYRRLAAASPTAFEPELARVLGNLGVNASELGRRAEALAVTEQGAAVYRRLAAANPAAFEPELARVIAHSGVCLTGLGRREEGLDATAEAVALYRRLAAANPAAFEPELARALSNTSSWLWGLGRRAEGLAAAGEAIALFRRLAAGSPAAFEPDLARALSNSGVLLWSVGERDEATTATEQAVAVYRRLAAASPAAFEPALATALSNYGIRLTGLGRRDDALAASRSAVALFERLAAENPAAFEPDLARSLTNLGICLSELGRSEEGLAAADRVAALYRRLAAENPAAFEPDLARSLANIGLRLSELGRPEDALSAAGQAVALYRRLGGSSPAAFEPDLARSLSNLGITQWNLGRRQEALSSFQEAVSLSERLAAASPGAFQADLATALTNLSGALAELGRLPAALAAAQRAVDAYRRLAAATPGGFEPALARSLTNLGLCLSGLGRPQDAIAAVQEAADLYRRLAAAYPAVFESDLAESLANLAALRR